MLSKLGAAEWFSHEYVYVGLENNPGLVMTICVVYIFLLPGAG